MIYFITDGTYTKIGKSKDPVRRIRTLQCSSPKTLKFLYCFDLDDKWEKELHKMLSEFKAEAMNEWFDFTNVNLPFILSAHAYHIETAEKAAELFNDKIDKGIIAIFHKDGTSTWFSDKLKKHVEKQNKKLNL